MIKHARIQNSFLLFERSYRQLMQGIRIACAIFIILICYLIFDKNIIFTWMGVCVLAIVTACIGTTRWNFKINMTLAYAVSTVAILLSTPFSYSFIGQCIYSFILGFFIFIFAYYKMNTVYSFNAYLLPQYALLASEQDFIYTLELAAMNTCAFLVCILICWLLFKPKLKKESYYELRAILREMEFYIDAAQNFTIVKNDINHRLATKEREELFVRIQNLRLIIGELKLHLQKSKQNVQDDPLHLHLILALQQESFAEIIVGLTVKIYNLNNIQGHEKQLNIVFDNLMNVNIAMLQFITRYKRRFTLPNILYFYETTLEKVVKEFNTFAVQYPENNEVFLIFMQFKDNMALLNSKLKFLSREENLLCPAMA